MILNKLEIETFGALGGRSFAFAAPFQLVCGPNEAGKTTLLQAIRGTLFGYPRENPYRFEGVRATVCKAELTLGDGRRVAIRRGYPQSQNRLAGEIDGEKIDGDGLQELLNNATPELFQHVFALSLIEIVQGQEGLKKARVDEAIYSGGMGGLALFQAARKAIEDDREALFLDGPNARNPRINALKREIEELEKGLRAAAVKPDAYKKLCEQAAQSQAEVDALDGRRQTIRPKSIRLDRLVQAIEPSLRLRQAEKSLAEIVVPPGFPADARERRSRIEERRGREEEALEKARGDLEKIDRKLAALALDPALIAQEGAILQLFQELGSVAKAREDLPAVAEKVDQARRYVARRLADLAPHWSEEQAARIDASVPRRRQLETLDQEHQGITTELASAAARIADRARQLEEDRRSLASIAPPGNVEILVPLAEQAGDDRARRRDLGKAQTELHQANVRLDQLQNRLAGQAGIPPERLAALPVPLETQVREFIARFARQDQRQRDAERDLELAQAKLIDLRKKLDQFDRRQQVPDRDQLRSEREQRDAGWRLVRRKYIDGQDVGEEIAAWIGERPAELPDLYEQAVGQADRLADDMQARADDVARREQILQNIEDQENEVANHEKKLHGVQSDQRDLEQAWADLWRPCELRPKSPETMQEWLASHAQFQEQLRQQAAIAAKHDDLRQKADQFADDLRSALGVESAAIDALLTIAQDRVDAARTAATQRDELQKRIPRYEQEHAALLEQMARLEGRLADWNKRFRAKLVEFDLPEDWDVGLAVTVLTGLSEVVARRDAIPPDELRVRQMQQTLEAFAAATAALCKAVAPDLAGLPPEDAVRRLNSQLVKARDAAQENRSLLAARKDAEKRVRDQQAKLDAANEQLAEQLAEAGAADEAAFQAAAEAFAVRRQRITEIDSLRRELAGMAGGDLEPFLAELAAADPDALRAEKQRSDEELAGLDREHARACGQSAIHRQAVEQVEAPAEVGKLQLELEGKRAELRAAVDRWAALTFASTLMKQAVQRFEREHQPALLEKVSELYCQLTRGRYVRIFKPLGEEDLAAEMADGTTKKPEQLSTGAREQLYLAIRLAYARHYCQQHEPLPLVMDDVLVNFDDARADAALEVLLGLGGAHQVIFLTCHQSTIDRIKRRLPTLEPIRMETS